MVLMRSPVCLRSIALPQLPDDLNSHNNSVDVPAGAEKGENQQSAKYMGPLSSAMGVDSVP